MRPREHTVTRDVGDMARLAKERQLWPQQRYWLTRPWATDAWRQERERLLGALVSATWS